MSEFAFIEWLRRQTPSQEGVLLGPGDDTAILQSSLAPLLVTTDMLLEGSCFLLDQSSPRLIGRKAMAVNLSDIAAMAGRPRFAVVSVGLPREHGATLARELYTGIRTMADAWGVSIVGGDTNTWQGPLAISVTLMGEVVGRGAVRRSGAEPGDWLLATGSFGGSIMSKHLTFTPRIAEALVLNEMVALHAMLDVSDGLAADLHHLCEESGCGAVVVADRIPISEDAGRMSDDKSPLMHALGDGEDFELLFAVSKSDGARLMASQPLTPLPLSHLGEFVRDGIWLETSGRREALPALGYVHQMS